MNINYELSDKMHNLINKAIRSNASKKGFGVFPTEKQFLNGVIYYWIRKNAPELIDVNIEIPEIIEHKLLKEIK